jgi:peptidoglycan/LPS O-acetylase OafA/YrhL
VLVVLAMTGLTGLSMLVFNRLSGWDAWAPYFFGAYGLGVLAHWLGRMSQPAWRGLGLAALAVGVAVALVVDYRERLLLAGIVALLLVLGTGTTGAPWRTRVALSSGWAPARALMAWLARLSYAVFLLHYPISLLVAALVTALAPDSLELNLLGLIGTWALTLASAHLVERQIGRWQQRRRGSRAAGRVGVVSAA